MHDKDNNYWKNEARNILQAEIARRGISHEELASRLKGLGVVRDISTTLFNGSFSFTFFLQCAKVIGVKTLRFKKN